jgi:hypothetical protein
MAATQALILVSSHAHAHDYGVDFLVQGFYNILGADNVFDYPEKPSLHLKTIGERDECNLACDATLPRKNIHEPPLTPDFVLLAYNAQDVEATLRAREVLSRLSRSTPVAILDQSDEVADLREQYCEGVGAKIPTYFKRECREDMKGAIPCPLSFPAFAARAFEWERKRKARVYYHATDHNGGAPGVPRRHIVEDLRSYIAPDQLDVELYRGQAAGTRPSPEQYWEGLSNALVGISWNGAPNWDCLRHWENPAFGCTFVAETPRNIIPYPFVNGVHCRYVEKPQQVAPAVTQLLRHRAHARKLAYAAHQIMEHLKRSGT